MLNVAALRLQVTEKCNFQANELTDLVRRKFLCRLQLCSKYLEAETGVCLRALESLSNSNSTSVNVQLVERLKKTPAGDPTLSCKISPKQIPDYVRVCGRGN